MSTALRWKAMHRLGLLLLAGGMVLALTPVRAHAQEPKQEVERSVDRAALPPAALTLLDGWWGTDGTDGVRARAYYRETDGTSMSYEAKFDWQGSRWSIEFDDDGVLQDVEQLIDYDDLPSAVQTGLHVYLDSTFATATLTRVQRQFTFAEVTSAADLLRALADADAEGVYIAYELEVNARDGRTIAAFELTVDDTGRLVQQRRIERRSTDNLLY